MCIEHRSAPVGRVFFAIIIALIAALAAHQGCSRRKQPNVLWITMDSLRPDHLGCYGYERARTPHIDALAGEGFQFHPCIAQAPYTHLSVPSMITGKYPRLAGVRAAGHDLKAEETTLAEILHGAGYRTVALPMSWKQGFNQGFERLYPVSRSTAQKTQWCLQSLDERDERPLFLWLYYWDPHVPYTPPEEFMRLYEPEYLSGEDEAQGRPRPFLTDEELRDLTGHYAARVEVLNRINEGRIRLTETERHHLINLYDAEVAFVDSKIAEVVAEMKKRGLWENTLVVLNADHGEGFGEHGRYYHGLTLYEDQIRVPLIIKPPRCRDGGRVIHGTVRNLDIVPTILEYCRIDPPKGLDGCSLRPFIRENRAPDLPACLETSGFWKGAGSEFQLAAIRKDGYKLIADLLGNSRQLYHLLKDPDERDDLLSDAAGAEVLEMEGRLRAELFSTLKVDELDDLKLTRQDLQMDRSTMQQLKALGYIY